MKPKLILKSLAELPANAFELAASLPARAVNATRLAFAPPPDNAWRPGELIRSLSARATAPMQVVRPWTRGGLNE